jgi:hypothetical protein
MTTRRVAPIAVAQMKVAQISKRGAGFQIVEREIPEPSAGRADQGAGLWCLPQ